MLIKQQAFLSTTVSYNKTIKNQKLDTFVSVSFYVFSDKTKDKN